MEPDALVRAGSFRQRWVGARRWLGRETLTRPPRWSSWLVAAMAATVSLYAIDVLFAPVSPGLSDTFQKFASSVVFFGAAILCAMKARASPDERSGWGLLALAMTLWGAAAVYYSVFLWDSPTVPLPSPADAGWIGFYAPAYVGIYKLLRKRCGAVSRGVWLDALIGGLGVGGASAALAFQNVLEHTHESASATATALAYPIGDLGLLALAVAGITVIGWRASGRWKWIALAFAVFAVTDSIYGIEVADGTYAVGGILDLGWPTVALFVGLAAWLPENLIHGLPRARARTILPATFGLLALALLVVDHYVGLNPLALGLATASILVILIRLYLTVQDNARMLALSRREATTDALTGLSNRRQLAIDLAAHLSKLDREQPLMLTVFDLDGFKQYNDRFGHPAGDQLLTRLGAKLRSTLSGHGTAYRTGGDEFCALWHLSDCAQASAKTLDAVEALSEDSEGFSIGCSYGSALLPNDTSDADTALTIADQRMFIRKNSARASAGRQSCDVLLRALEERNSRLGVDAEKRLGLVSAISSRLGLSEEDVEAARQTALLLDVGKLAIPDEILNKLEPLTPSEWGFIRQHPLIAERILRTAPALATVAKLVRSAHERYDGTGYPDGLAGEDIPLIARIVAVCNAYEAITGGRSYQTPRDTGQAVSELRRSAGTQLDGSIVEILADALFANDESNRGPTLGAHDSLVSEFVGVA